MKPLKLTMTAFGPYGGTVEVDFSKLGTQGLYIITGATGAGKTTIFDAICYALYGETSGTVRETNDVRSDYADPTAEASVCLEFSHQDKLYRITRKPSQYRQAKRKKKGSDGMAKSQAMVLLEFLSDSQRKPIEKINAADKEIAENILKITYEQFKQIVMIAQGEFQQALTTETGERSEVMRKIFQTEPYDVLAKLLDEKRKVFSKKVELSNNDIKAHFMQIECGDDSVYSVELKEKKDSVISAVAIEIIENLVKGIADEDGKSLAAEREIKSVADKQVENAAKNLQAAENHNDNIENLQKLLQVEKDLDAKAEFYKEKAAEMEIIQKVVYKVRPLYDDVKKQLHELKRVEENIRFNAAEIERTQIAEREAGQAELSAISQQDRARKLTEESARLKGTKDSYERREALKKLVMSCEQHKIKAENEFKSVNEAMTRCEKKLAVARNLEKQCESTPAKLVKVKNKLQQLGLCMGYMNRNLQGKSRELQEKLRLYRQQEKNSIEADIKRDNAQSKLNNVNIEIRCNRAGILAADLKVGEKCPVCGSIEHPELAHLSGTKFTDADLDKAQLSLNNAMDISNNATLAKLSALNDYRNSAKNTVDKINDVIDNVRQSCDDGENILAVVNWQKCASLLDMSQDDVSYEILNENLHILEQELQKATDLKSEIQGINKRFTDEEFDLEQKVEILTKARQVIAECEQDLDGLKERNQSAMDGQKKASEELEKAKGELSGIGNLEYNSLAELQQQVNKLDDEVKAISKNIEEKQRAYNEAKLKSGKAVARGEMLKKQLADVKNKLEKAEALYKSALRTNDFTDESIFLAYVDKSDKDIEYLQQLIAEYKNKVLKNKTSIEDVRKLVGDDIEIRALDGLKKDLLAANEIRDKSNTRLTVIQERMKKNKLCWNKIHDISSKVKAEMGQAVMYDRLYTTVSGTKAGDNKGNGKMSLEEYVQAAHFERILESANERMKQISGGVYELCRHDEGTAEQGKTIGGNAHNCLNLDVLDTNTNKRRLARSLSGGESFMASLSLALGFSDEIMAKMGGISVDTMFIDEGFGTLDGNRLTDTMNMLTHLSHGNRMIGIISHNSKLEECIPNQIIVKKDGTKGSSLKISIDGEII